MKLANIPFNRKARMLFYLLSQRVTLTRLHLYIEFIIVKLFDGCSIVIAKVFHLAAAVCYTELVNEEHFHSDDVVEVFRNSSRDSGGGGMQLIIKSFASFIEPC